MEKEEEKGIAEVIRESDVAKEMREVDEKVMMGMLKKIGVEVVGVEEQAAQVN